MGEESKATEEGPERGISYSNRDAVHVTEMCQRNSVSICRRDVALRFVSLELKSTNKRGLHILLVPILESSAQYVPSVFNVPVFAPECIDA